VSAIPKAPHRTHATLQLKGLDSDSPAFVGTLYTLLNVLRAAISTAQTLMKEKASRDYRFIHERTKCATYMILMLLVSDVNYSKSSASYSKLTYTLTDISKTERQRDRALLEA
jgi:hypothetical protein